MGSGAEVACLCGWDDGAGFGLKASVFLLPRPLKRIGAIFPEHGGGHVISLRPR